MKSAAQSDLTAEFTAGREAALDGKGADACPFYATSKGADAWHAGQAFERGRPSDFVAGKVTHGRGYLVNVAHDKSVIPIGRFPRLVFKVAYDNGAARATREG